MLRRSETRSGFGGAIWFDACGCGCAAINLGGEGEDPRGGEEGFAGREVFVRAAGEREDEDVERGVLGDVESVGEVFGGWGPIAGELEGEGGRDGGMGMVVKSRHDVRSLHGAFDFARGLFGNVEKYV